MHRGSRPGGACCRIACASSRHWMHSCSIVLPVWHPPSPCPLLCRLPAIFMDLKGPAFTKDAVARIAREAADLRIAPHVAVFVMTPEQEALAAAAGYQGPLIRGYMDKKDPNPTLSAAGLASYAMLGPRCACRDGLLRGLPGTALQGRARHSVGKCRGAHAWHERGGGRAAAEPSGEAPQEKTKRDGLLAAASTWRTPSSSGRWSWRSRCMCGRWTRRPHCTGALVLGAWHAWRRGRAGKQSVGGGAAKAARKLAALPAAPTLPG